MMNLGLGTAQFGFDYGVSNRTGQTPKAEVERILAYADEQDIRMIDTAPTYGTSEIVLGELLPSDHNFKIVTKTRPCTCTRVGATMQKELIATFYQSLENLKQSKLYGLLLHHTDDLFLIGGERFIDALCQLKAEGLVEKIGVSVYTGEQIDDIAQKFIPDLVQVPINLLDQRLIQSGHLAQLAAAGVEIHARSVFLQGLLLMDANDLSAYFDPIKNHLQTLHRELDAKRISRLTAALDFVMRQKEISAVVVGVAALSELVDVVTAVASLPLHGMDYSKCALSESRFLNPFEWKVAEALALTER
jgi:aryl-alcohol dehydrogenase-like predicted oxidoreductase